MGSDACKCDTSVLQTNKRFEHPDKEFNGHSIIVLDCQGAGMNNIHSLNKTLSFGFLLIQKHQF